MNQAQEIRVRIPPSPTGLLHVGTVKAFLNNFLFARQKGGKIVFRFEDTDKERSKKEYADNILEGLLKLGLSFDEGPFYQSKRNDIYEKYLKKLLQNKNAYYCFCSVEEIEKKRQEQKAAKLPPRHQCDCSLISLEKAQERAKKEKFCLRFCVPLNQDIVFNDLIKGEIKVNTKEIADFVIAKDFSSPLYNFCNVVDDMEMKISHVIRGEDGISNTPRQILIYQALAFKIPYFAHFPLFLNPDKTKLSKRKNKVSIDDFLQDGILPEALVNFIALLGFSTADEREIFSIDELIREFDFKRVQKSAAIFDNQKLLWMNSVYIRKKDFSEFKKLAKIYLSKEKIDFSKKGEAFLEKVLQTTQERLKKLSDLPSLVKFFFVEKLSFSTDLFVHEKMKVNLDIAKKALEKGIEILEKVEKWRVDFLEEILISEIRKLNWKNGQLLWPLRVALSGEKFSPGVFELLNIFGKKESLYRLKSAYQLLN